MGLSRRQLLAAPGFLLARKSTLAKPRIQYHHYVNGTRAYTLASPRKLKDWTFTITQSYGTLAASMTVVMSMRSTMTLNGTCTCCGRKVETTHGCLQCANRTWDSNGNLISCGCGFTAKPAKKESDEDQEC